MQPRGGGGFCLHSVSVLLRGAGARHTRPPSSSVADGASLALIERVPKGAAVRMPSCVASGERPLHVLTGPATSRFGVDYP